MIKKEIGKINKKKYYRFDIDNKTWEGIRSHLTGKDGYTAE